ncbi:MAG: hypothetical protein ACLGGX_04070 [Bdellovibrionia bacterium]
MKSNWDRLLNVFLISLVFILFAGIETTLWPYILGTIPSPMFWLCVIIYTTLYRRMTVGIGFIYVFSLLLLGFSLMPLKMILIPLALLFIVLNSFKGRVFWSGPSYFVLVSSAASFFYHIIYIAVSYWLERNPATIEWESRLLTLLFTPLVTYPIYLIINTIDRWTHSEHLAESGGFEL